MLQRASLSFEAEKPQYCQKTLLPLRRSTAHEEARQSLDLLAGGSLPPYLLARVPVAASLVWVWQPRRLQRANSVSKNQLRNKDGYFSAGCGFTRHMRALCFQKGLPRFHHDFSSPSQKLLPHAMVSLVFVGPLPELMQLTKMAQK